MSCWCYGSILVSNTRGAWVAGSSASTVMTNIFITELLNLGKTQFRPIIFSNVMAWNQNKYFWFCENVLTIAWITATEWGRWLLSQNVILWNQYWKWVEWRSCFVCEPKVTWPICKLLLKNKNLVSFLVCQSCCIKLSRKLFRRPYRVIANLVFFSNSSEILIDWCQ